MDNNGIDFQEAQPVESKTESEIKQQIYEKVRRRLAELETDRQEGASFCRELSPDVIVISDDQSLLFEPQNSRASEFLSQCCGSGLEAFAVKECIRVHPVGSHKLISDLTKAGLNVAQECSS
jgi:hypothetical protein